MAVIPYERFSCQLGQGPMRWLRTQAKKHRVSMSAIIRALVAREMKRPRLDVLA